MVDSSQSEHNFFQFDPVQIGSDWAVGDGPQQNRSPKMKMSNFGALNYGNRFGFDYTRTDFDFAQKSEMEGADKMGMHSLTQDAELNDNPLVAGSTLKYTRDDQFVRTGMTRGGTHEADLPGHDVMDTDVSHGPWTSGLNYPTEGWRSFGGKYDFEPYTGVVR